MTPCYVSGWTSFSQMFMSDSCCSLCPKVCQINRILGTDGEVRNWHSSHVPYHPSCPSGWKKQSSTSTHVSLVVLPIACQIYVNFKKQQFIFKKTRETMKSFDITFEDLTASWFPLYFTLVIFADIERLCVSLTLHPWEKTCTYKVEWC